MIIPHRQLSEEVLTGVIEEYVTRDGTELSEASAKVAAVRRGLDLRTLVLVYDPDAESCNILPADQLDESVEPHSPYTGSR